MVINQLKKQKRKNQSIKSIFKFGSILDLETNKV
jgi:hypothetical protein